MPEDLEKKAFLCHYADTAYDTGPAQPTEDVGRYRLLQQGKLYQLK